MVKKIKFSNCYSESRTKPEHFQKIEGESLTNVSRMEDTDIKIMCAKYGLNSVLARSEVTEPLYGYDLTLSTDINERLEIKERLKQYFYEQPAKIRKHFKDDYKAFIEMYEQGDHETMKYLGIIKEEKKIDETIIQTGTNANNQGTMEGNTATPNNAAQGTNT